MRLFQNGAKKTQVFLVVLLLASLCSCIGVKADITVLANGSGKLVLEYRVSRMIEALGRLDGNERWQTIPLGRADFERTMARLPNLRLASFSSSGNERDIINRAELEFKNMEDLMTFLNPSGSVKYGSFTGENGKNRLHLLLSEEQPEIDEDLLSLVRELSSEYEFSFSLSVPGTAALSLTGAPPRTAHLVPSGKKVSFSVNTGELLSLPGGMGLDFNW